MDENKDDSEKRKDLLELVKKGEVTIVENLATRFECGASGRLENVVEMIYPTEYEPPEGLPLDSPMNRPDEQLTPMDRQLKVAMMHASPTAFDTRNLGVSLEAEVRAVTVGEKQWDVTLVFSRVKYLKNSTWVEDTIQMPVFSVTKSTHFLRVEDTQWSILSNQAKVSNEGVLDPETTQLSFLRVQQVR